MSILYSIIVLALLSSPVNADDLDSCSAYRPGQNLDWVSTPLAAAEAGAAASSYPDRNVFGARNQIGNRCGITESGEHTWNYIMCNSSETACQTINVYSSAIVEPAPNVDDYNQECDAIKPDYVTLPVDPGLGFSWDSGGCSFSTSDVVPCLETPSGEYSCIVSTAEALEVEPEIVEEPVPVDGRDSTQEYTETTDPAADCPFSNVTWDGTSYCYNGPDADQGAEYADTSTRVNHYDGSYTVTDSEGNSQTYNPDGSPTGTASYDPGAGPGTGDLGCPAWICSDEGVPDGGDGDGDGSGAGPPGLPVVQDDFSDGVDWSSGLATTASCPAPQVVPLSFAGMSNNLEFSYQGFCDFASLIRSLVLAAAYISAAFLVYRGITS